MKKLIFIFFLLGGIIAKSQVLTDSTMQVVAYYEIGETYKYDGWYGEYQLGEEDTTLIREFKTLYEITVKDIQDSLYIMQGILLDYEVMDDNSTTKEQSENSFESFKNVPVIYSLNNLGIFQEIINWEEIQGLVLIRLEKEVDKKLALQRDSMQESILTREKMLEIVKKPFSTREDIQTKLGENFRLLYTYHGGLYNLHDTYPYNIAVKNIITGDDIPATGEFWIEEMDVEDQVIHMEMRMEVKIEDFFDSLLHWVYDLIKDDPEVAAMDKEELTTEKILEYMPYLKYIQSFYHVIETGTGWTLFYQYLQEMNIQNVEILKVFEFEIQNVD